MKWIKTCVDNKEYKLEGDLVLDKLKSKLPSCPNCKSEMFENLDPIAESLLKFKEEEIDNDIIPVWAP